MRGKVLWLLLAAFLAASAYMAFYYLGQHEIQAQLQPYHENTYYRLYIMEYVKIVEGETEFSFSRKVEIPQIEPFANSQVDEIRRLAPNRLIVFCEKQCSVRRIKIRAYKTSGADPEQLVLTARSRSRFHWPLAIPQFLFLFFLAAASAAAVVLVWRLLFNIPPLGPWAKLACGFLSAALLICFLFFLSAKPSPFLSSFGFSWAQMAEVNLVIALVLLAAFLYFQKKPLSSILWFVAFLILLFLLFNPGFNPRKIGDATKWAHWLKEYSLSHVSFSEMLGLLWIKGIQAFFAAMGMIKHALDVFSIGAKILGLLYFFSLYFLAKSLRSLSERGRIMFFLGALALPLSLMFLGVPEISFYSQPFLVLGIAFAMKHSQAPTGWGRYFLALFFFLAAGLFHGSGFFSLPALLLLPFLTKTRSKDGVARKRTGWIMASILAVPIMALTLTAVILLFNFLGIQIGLSQTLGGIDHTMFVSMAPGLSFFRNTTFTSSGYFWLRGWIVATAIPLVFFPLPFLLRRIKIEGEELFLFLVALSQFVIPLFWNFDLRVKDFDLFITSVSALNLFLLLAFSKIAENEKQHWGMLFFLLLGLLHPSYIIFRYATQ